MILKQLKRIGDAAFEIEGQTEFHRLVRTNAKLPDDIEKVVIMDVNVKELLSLENSDDITEDSISFQLSEYTADNIFNYILDTPYGRNQNYSPILLWTDSGKTPEKKLKKKKLKLTNMYKKQLQLLEKWDKKNKLNKNETWYLDYLSWFSEENNQDKFLKYLTKYMEKKKEKLNKGTWRDLIIVPRFSNFNNSGENEILPGEIELIKRIYLSLKKPKSETEKKCMICDKLKEIPIKATQANKTKWYTTDQLAFIMYFFEDEYSAAPICYDCLDSIEKGLMVAREIGKKFKLGFALKEGGSMKKLYQMIIPLSIDKDHLKNLIESFRNVSQSDLIHDEMKAVTKLEQEDPDLGEDGADEGNGSIDLISMLYNDDFVETSYLFLHYVKEESGGMHRLISQSMTKRDYLKKMKEIINKIKRDFPRRRVNIKSLFYLFNFDPKESNNYLGKNADGSPSTLATYTDEVFYYLNALLTGEKVFRDEFIKNAFKTIKQANEIYCKCQIKFQEQDSSKIFKKSNLNARFKTESFMMFYRLFDELGLFIGN